MESNEKKIFVCIYLVWKRGSSLKFMCMFMLSIEYFHVDDFLFTIKLRIVLKYWMSLVWLFGTIPAVFFSLQSVLPTLFEKYYIQMHFVVSLLWLLYLKVNKI